MIAALYVDPHGIYANLPGVDVWGEDRDARLYAGPWPVVAHPPCHLWVNFAALNFKRWGGDHNRPGNDGGCFSAALAAVRRNGGVLEHPAGSMAWAAHGLVAPRGTGWQRTLDGEWVCEVWQSAYGHRARKRTWLFYSGHAPPSELDWRRHPGVAQIGRFDTIKPVLGSREASATPQAFRDVLISLARSSHPPRTRVECTREDA